MATTITRRPLPALVSLLALLALTGIVWWRVANRDDAGHTSTKPTHSPTCRTSQAPQRVAAVAPKAVTVRVLNSTDRGGIAGKARTKLLSYGFHIPTAAANDSATVSIKQSAQIRYGTAGTAGARLLQHYFPGSVLSKIDSSSATVTVSLGDGYQGVASAARVKAELAKAAKSVSPTGSGSAVPTGSASSSAATPAC